MKYIFVSGYLYGILYSVVKTNFFVPKWHIGYKEFKWLKCVILFFLKVDFVNNRDSRIFGNDFKDDETL